MVVRAGYGIYYDQINTTTMRGVVAGYPGFITTQIANDSRSGLQIPNDFFPNLPTRTFPESAGTAFNIASDSAESPYTHQMTAGATRQFGTNYAVSFDYVYMRGESFPVTRNVNARRADNTFPLIASGTRLLLYADEAPMRIHQAQFRLQKRFANRLGFLLGYTLGSAKTVANGATPVEPLRSDEGLGPDRQRRAAPLRLQRDLRAAVAVPGRVDRHRQLGAALQHHPRHRCQPRRRQLRSAAGRRIQRRPRRPASSRPTCGSRRR